MDTDLKVTPFGLGKVISFSFLAQESMAATTAMANAVLKSEVLAIGGWLFMIGVGLKVLVGSNIWGIGKFLVDFALFGQ
jgi:hypothetical protein